MLNIEREYFALEKDRFLYQTKFKDKSKCDVYGRKKFITEAGAEELSAHVFLISKDFWTFNAGQLDFTNYPNGIWNDYISIDIIQRDEYTAPSINFGSMGDITPENLQSLSDYISKHLSDLEKRIVEDYLFIDEGTAENIGLPNLPENHFWVRKNGVIVGVNLDYLKKDYIFLKEELKKDFESFYSKTFEAIKINIRKWYEEFLEEVIKDLEEQEGIVLEDLKDKARAFLDEYVENTSKPQINSHVSEKRGELDTYTAKKKSELDVFIAEKKEDLKGDKGDQGIQGVQGIKGDKGDRGEQGIQGQKGEQGNQGIQGEKGEQGLKGDQGIQGVQGIKGDQGETGPQGAKGETGNQGIQGIQGQKGDQGEIGATGPQGIQGIKGDKGDKGDRGDAGAIVEASGLYCFTVKEDGCLYLIYQGKERPNFYIDENGNLIYSTEPYFPQQKKLVVNLTQDDFKNNRVGSVKLYNGNNLLTTFGNNKNESYNENDLCYNSQEGFFFIGRNKESIYINIKEFDLFNATKKLTIEFQFSQTDIANDWSNPLFLTSMENFIHDAGDINYRTTSGIRLEYSDRNGNLYFCPSPFTDGTDGKISPLGIVNDKKHSVIIIIENTKAVVYFDYVKIGECNIHQIPKINYIGLNKAHGTNRCCNMKIYGLKVWKDTILTEEEIEYIKNSEVI